MLSENPTGKDGRREAGTVASSATDVHEVRVDDVGAVKAHGNDSVNEVDVESDRVLGLGVDGNATGAGAVVVASRSTVARAVVAAPLRTLI